MGGVLGCQKKKSLGNVTKCQKKKKKTGGGGESFRGGGGVKNQKSGKFQELPRKSIHFFNPPSEDGERERRTGGRGQGGRKGGRQGRRGPSEAG